MVAFFTVSLALSNWHSANLSLHPFSPYIQEISFVAPMFIMVAVILLFGIIIGAVAMWFSQRPWRLMARNATRDSQRLKRNYETPPETKTEPQIEDIPRQLHAPIRSDKEG